MMRRLQRRSGRSFRPGCGGSGSGRRRRRPETIAAFGQHHERVRHPPVVVVAIAVTVAATAAVRHATTVHYLQSKRRSPHVASAGTSVNRQNKTEKKIGNELLTCNDYDTLMLYNLPRDYTEKKLYPPAGICWFRSIMWSRRDKR